MADRKETSQQEHDNLVRMMVRHFDDLGYTNIKADLEGCELKPDEIDGHIPDLICNKNDTYGTKIILEAETCETISDDHTEDQWTSFRDAADEEGGEFHIVIPRICDSSSGREKVKERLEELEIEADEIWTPKE